MELREPKAKKQCRISEDSVLPIILKKDGSVKKTLGYFNGFSVVINDPNDMKTVISKGYFGKARFSRSYPQFNKTETEILRHRQFVNRNSTFDKFTDENRPRKVIVLPDSDSDNEEYFTNLQPKYEMDRSGQLETVWLGLEEAFFLNNAIKCLDISFNNKLLSSQELWELFQTKQHNFVRNYIVYFYYRAKNWVVKPGIKFGGDFMLYKQGPPFYHASYVVVIEVVDENSKRNEELTNRAMDSISILGLNRLCETSGKELLICTLRWPENNILSFDNFSQIKVQEVLVRRWIASQERDADS
ncbi:hypothetical protein ABEB36_010035 [Hypothenemus hampei]|uniref:tRNA-splicing endonuclease subunit Sen2 n=1 Tax=Hypothenemus hampei TaxID=57062 RepID=A0ABD1EIA4_HYPHA